MRQIIKAAGVGHFCFGESFLFQKFHGFFAAAVPDVGSGSAAADLLKASEKGRTRKICQMTKAVNGQLFAQVTMNMFQRYEDAAGIFMLLPRFFHLPGKKP